MYCLLLFVLVVGRIYFPFVNTIWRLAHQICGFTCMSYVMTKLLMKVSSVLCFCYLTLDTKYNIVYDRHFQLPICFTILTV